jgi:polyisoprenoid-binding protein YceI
MATVDGTLLVHRRSFSLHQSTGFTYKETENRMLNRKRIATVLLSLGGLSVVAAYQHRNADAANTNVPTSTGEAVLPATDGVQLVVAPSGNEVRYRVREQLVGLELPNDAVGATSEVTGGVAFDAKGVLVPMSSKFVVNIGSLKSDKDRRDGYVRGRILEANQYPTVEFAPTILRGLTSPLPTSGSTSFQMVGNLTVHGVTKPTTWQVDAKFDGGKVSGSAVTAFPFSDFGLTQPRVPVVLSVADTITLEYTFSLVPKQ